MQHDAMILVYIHNVATLICILVTYVVHVMTKFNDMAQSYGMQVILCHDIENV